MEKLTLKELAPYLPYKLKILHGDKQKVMNAGQGSSKYWIGISSVIKWQNTKAGCKPILRPLSDLVKEITVNGERFVPIDEICEIHSISFNQKSKKFSDVALQGVVNIDGYDFGKPYSYKFLPYCVMQKLFELHFDVFGLIESGLAIDINTLNQKL